MSRTFAQRYARLALAAAFWSAVAARFGLWSGAFDLNHFHRFELYTAQVNSFLPASWSPVLAWAATVAETALGLALLLGVRLEVVGPAAAMLLAVFGTAMAISQGVKEPLDYSVFSASSAALLLAFAREPKSG